MADQIFNVECGFFDAIDSDRVYSADQMNNPYKRLISNGVFATPQGTPSTDLQVISTGSGMNIIVSAGQGLFGDKWFENNSGISIVVPDNTGLTPRIDSVLVQVDKRASGRVGNIVYRTGIAASNPTPPEINTETGVSEYRVANIYVSAGASTITYENITDMRGSSECPWVTSLVYQVDTSVLFRQWQAAYESYYAEITADYEEYVVEQRTAWEAFIESLTEELTVSTCVVAYSDTETTIGQTSTMQIGVQSYDKDTDILQVYINGLLGIEGIDYTVNVAGTEITFASQLAAGQDVTFVVLKSIVSGDIQSAVSLMQTLDTKLSNYMADTGWNNLTLENGATAFDSNTTPEIRKIGDKVFLRGSFKGLTTLQEAVCTVPVSCIPSAEQKWVTAAMSGTTLNDTIVMEIDTSGSVKMVAASGTLSATDEISIATDYIVG